MYAYENQTNDKAKVIDIFSMIFALIFFLLASAFINQKIIEIPAVYQYFGFAVIGIYAVLIKLRGMF